MQTQQSSSELRSENCHGHASYGRNIAPVARHWMPYFLALVVMVGSMCSSSSRGKAATTPDTSPPTSTAQQRQVARTVGALASDKWRTRRQAQRRLLSTKGFILPQLAAAMAKTKNPEQRNRLLRICMQLYLRQFNWLHHGNAFIGVEFITDPLELRKHGKPQWIPAVAVVRTVPGFPGGLYLRENDLIMGINGHKIPAYNTATAFRAEIQKHPPGSRITLLLLRDGKLIRVSLKLTGIPNDPLAGQELLNQRNLIVQHLIAKYLPSTFLSLTAVPHMDSSMRQR